MIVNSRFVFVHNPRTGGTSISKALGGQTAEAQNLPLFRVARNGRFAFGFVRNPWSRMASLYHHMVKLHSMRESFQIWLMTMSDHLSTDSRIFQPLQRRSQMWWLDGCDFIGRFESIDADFAHALELAGEEPRALPHVNKIGCDDWRGEYDDETCAFVQKHFARDIARFGYGFDEEAA